MVIYKKIFVSLIVLSIVAVAFAATSLAQTKSQAVKMTEKTIGYAPQNFTITKNTPVNWEIEVQKKHGCAGNLTLPKLGIKKKLKLGKNLIQFTPTKVGSYDFSCSKGRGRGSFRVVEPKPEAKKAQIIKATYTNLNDIQPNYFMVKANQPVRLEIEVKETSEGCMSDIMIPYLFETPKPLIAGQKIIMEFLPTETGLYEITCPMGVARGRILVGK